MNVCLISREYPPFFGGGIGTYTVQWAKTLAAGGHRVVVVTVSDDGKVGRQVANGVTVVRLPFLKGMDWSGPHPAIATPEAVGAFRGLPAVSVLGMQIEKALPELHREFKFDIIEAPDTGALAWFGLNNRRTGGSWRDLPPVVTTVHSPSAWIAEYNRQPLRSRADFELAAMERDCGHWSDALISPSAGLAEWVREHWDIPESGLQVIPYPLGDLQGTPQPEEPAARNGVFRVLFIGRLEPRKGVDTLMESLAHVNGLEIEVSLVGEDTPDPSGQGLFGANSLRSLVPESRRHSVRLIGRKSPAELPAMRAAADAIVLPSPMDNFPYVCVEAMAEGRLVLASSRGGTGEMIRDGVDGFLFAPGDAKDCARVLERAARSDAAALKALRRSAAARIGAFCGNEAIRARRIEHYQQTIDRARVPSEVPGAFVVINRGSATTAELDRLTRAARSAGADFAHAWVATDAGVLAFSTPTTHTLALGPRALGPLVVRAEAIATRGVMELLRSVPASPGEFRTESTWIVAMALCQGGRRGVCLPDLTIEVPPTGLHPVDREVAEELASIRASRAWRVVNRVYDVLHILRGRGWRRPYHLRKPRRKV